MAVQVAVNGSLDVHKTNKLKISQLSREFRSIVSTNCGFVQEVVRDTSFCPSAFLERLDKLGTSALKPVTILLTSYICNLQDQLGLRDLSGINGASEPSLSSVGAATDRIGLVTQAVSRTDIDLHRLSICFPWIHSDIPLNVLVPTLESTIPEVAQKAIQFPDAMKSFYFPYLVPKRMDRKIVAQFRSCHSLFISAVQRISAETPGFGTNDDGEIACSLPIIDFDDAVATDLLTDDEKYGHLLRLGLINEYSKNDAGFYTSAINQDIADISRIN
ncbi:hypothetical protein AYI68_g1031 [Smittium mucronatum]|uniref:Uncharacterized protein n=1 Tax=Smittium mucronatum TaxID=133383 RepID=A0A1R0H6T7_9FUNG|nr:hypothetical protein AYI68_g1031 [Smittium mucronatum]